MKMKLKQILLIFLLFNFVINNNNNKVINACGSGDIIKNYNQPKNKTDCEDKNEGYCKFVSIIIENGIQTNFCAIIHGDYEDEDTLKDVAKLINASSIFVDESKYLIGKNSIIYYIFFYILIFLF